MKKIERKLIGMNSGEAAESVVRMSLQGTEVTLRLTGVAAKNIAALLYAIYRGKKQTKGKTKLEKLLKSGRPLKVFSVRKEELKFFQQVAKRYGILYALLIDKKHQDKDGMIDFMVRTEDAARINRIINRYKFSTYKETTVEHENDSPKDYNKKTHGKNVRTKDDDIVDDILSKPSKNKNKDKSDEEIMKDLFSNQSKNKSENKVKKNQSEPSLKNKKSSEIGTKKKESVRKKLRKIKESLVNKKEENLLDKEKSSHER